MLDGLKGIAPVLLAGAFSFSPGFAGIGAIAGHIFNPLFRFRGGKGVSTTIGVALGLAPLSFLLAIGVWLIVYLLTRIVSLASLCLAITLPVIIIITKETDSMTRFLIAIICLFVILAHYKNIRRLIAGQEPTTVFGKKKEAGQ